MTLEQAILALMARQDLTDKQKASLDRLIQSKLKLTKETLK